MATSTNPCLLLPQASFFVEKKDRGLWPYIDYQDLNAMMVKYWYPLPLVPSPSELVRRAKVFTNLDLRSACNLICIREWNEWKITFVTNTGHYEYFVMTYGLDHHGHLDLLKNRGGPCHSDTGHNNQSVKNKKLYVKLHKLHTCELHKTFVKFLGYILYQKGTEMDQGKVDALSPLCHLF